MKTLAPKRRSELRAEAHKLSPIVIIGDKGLTDEVVAEIDRSLKAHELIKVRAATNEREARAAWLDAICERLQAHPVQQIGKVFVLYRENPEEAAAPRAPAPAEKPARRGGSKVSREANQRQRARDDEKRRALDIRDMVRKGKIPATAKLAPGPKPGPRPRPDGDAIRTSRPRSRTPSPLPESGPRRRRPRTSR
ncbi:MAG TPA: ribosome assembly RNA-binding protein YhbY [Usitatibacter sp.]|nr:ribosome assembly RNA-binding protein YhbY [Usitatibacter sp.]